MTAKYQGLVVVSNRIPITFSGKDGDLTPHPSSGGLVSALEPLLDDHGGTWIGSPGSAESPEIHHLLEETTRGRRFRFAPLFLSEEETHNFYHGFSNEVIWPLFHDLQSRCNFEPNYWQFYLRVNQRFAEMVERTAADDDLIWIHDYQLMQVGRMVREHRPASRLAFFLHIPFPPPDIFEKLPWRREILEGLLEHDLVGMQTKRDERNFIACLRSFVPAIKIANRHEGHVAITDQRQTHVQFFPISINYREFSEAAASASVAQRMQEIRRALAGTQIALGVDRLDYTKGIPERLKAFRSLLREHPEFLRRVQLIQIVVPSRESIPGYQDLKSEV
ncbi:MAG TPA: trehalose-6-phosphate synthase, partial [Acidobacteriaceae bacterium]|nr:trehalose-6-phosphate synthase [Acidobacteriaceae bacterium]